MPRAKARTWPDCLICEESYSDLTLRVLAGFDDAMAAARSKVLFEKGIKLKNSGNEVCYTA